MLFARQKLYEHGNKPGRLLARLARGRIDTNIISSLKDGKGGTAHDSKQINTIMREFYQKLYSSETSASEDLCYSFLEKINLPCLAEDQSADLNSLITKEEVVEAIKSLKGGKAPGPDGFAAEFYKKMCKFISEPLTDMYMDSFRKGSLPTSLNMAYISLIQKKNKPPDECGSYRPISLINVDCKLLSKILAKRLDSYLPQLINPDQTGFIKQRWSYSNIRRLLNVIQFSQVSKTRALAVSLDAEKAFDRIEWAYMFKVLDKFNLGVNFIKWIRMLYYSPTACVITNGLRSLPFQLGRGTRQGCPLSPLLFALVLEPLAETIRNHSGIQGVTIGHVVHKVALYADDILLFLTNAITSIPAVLKTIYAFSLISGYKINYDKSEMMALGGAATTESLLDCPFKWSKRGFTYLGIQVSPDLSDLWKLNVAPLIKCVKDDLERWFNLNISWMGRINLIRMNILPRILYPMQMLPLRFPIKSITELERSFSKFIWRGKRPRVRMKTLQLPVDRGGQALPNLKFYNWACHIRTIWIWLQSHLDLKPCVDEWAASPYSLLSLITNNSGLKSLPDIRNNPIISHTVKVWQDVMAFVGRRGLLSSLTPLIHNRDFLPGVQKSIFHRWHALGIKTVGDLYLDTSLMTFAQLQEKFKLGREHFWGYLQIRHFLNSAVEPQYDLPRLCDLDCFLIKLQGTQHLISKVYSLLYSMDPGSIDHIRRIWEKDLCNEYIDDDWVEAVDSIRKTFTCNRLAETQYEILLRLFITPRTLNKIDKKHSPLCNKCQQEIGTFMHCFWQCPAISKFWDNVARKLGSIFNTTFNKDPGYFVVGLPPKDTALNANGFLLCDKLLLLARKCILNMWISSKPPSLTLWYREIFRVLPMERLTAVVRGNSNMFIRTWRPVLDSLPTSLQDIIFKGGFVWEE